MTTTTAQDFIEPVIALAVLATIIQGLLIHGQTSLAAVVALFAGAVLVVMVGFSIALQITKPRTSRRINQSWQTAHP